MLLPSAPISTRSHIEQDINLLEYGLVGEERILFELRNSHIPMYVLHDVYIEHEGLTAQIDFIVITPKINFIIECKNLFGNIEINEKGDFIRTIYYGKAYKKEGIYSPITQNKRHLDLIRQIKIACRGNIVTKTIVDKSFDSFYKGIVVLANPKTVLNDKNAPKEIKSQVIRADNLVEYINTSNKASKEIASSDAEMKQAAEKFLDMHTENPNDYCAKYKLENIETNAKSFAPVKKDIQKMSKAKPIAAMTSKTAPICPKCNVPMVLRTATKGERSGKKFWGCTNYPKCRSIVNVEE